MPQAKGDPKYRLMVFDQADEPQAVRDLFCKVTGLHPTDAMVWVAKLPGVWPHPLPERQTRALLDGLYELEVAAEAWVTDKYPDLSPARTIHDAACLAEGFRVKGVRGEPTHWVPWDKVELICAGRVETADEFRVQKPPSWPSAVATGFRALTFRKPRVSRATRVPRDPLGEVIIVRNGPLIAFRVVENQMNYSYLGDRLSPVASANFPIFVADLCARADDATITPTTRVFFQKDEAEEVMFPTSQALLDYANHRLLWSRYQRDREKHLRREGYDGTVAEE